jgi:hypothetical protein
MPYFDRVHTDRVQIRLVDGNTRILTVNEYDESVVRRRTLGCLTATDLDDFLPEGVLTCRDDRLVLCCVEHKRVENGRAWKVRASDVLAKGCNLDIKNPNAADDLEHLPPEQLVEDILVKEQRIIEIMHEIKQVLAKSR